MASEDLWVWVICSYCNVLWPFCSLRDVWLIMCYPEVRTSLCSQHYPLNKQSQKLWAPHLTEQVSLQMLTEKKKGRKLNEPNGMKWKEFHRVLTWELGRGQPTTQETFSVRAAQRYMRLYIVFNIPPWLLLLTTYNEYILSDAAVFVGVLSGSAMILGNMESTLFTLAEKEASN